MAFSDDMKRLARDAIADVGNTYQALLMQNTGWARSGTFARGINQEVSEDVSRNANEPKPGPGDEPRTGQGPEIEPG